MIYATFGKRIASSVIDGFLIFIILYTISGWILVSLWGDAINMQAAPFVVINMILLPLDFFIRTLRYPRACGNVSIYYLLSGILFFVEVMYYSLIEISPLKDTIGHFCTKIHICSARKIPTTFFPIILRNCLKTLSRYLFAIPFLVMLFTDKKQTLYDLMSNIVVVQR